MPHSHLRTRGRKKGTKTDKLGAETNRTKKKQTQNIAKKSFIKQSAERVAS